MKKVIDKTTNVNESTKHYENGSAVWEMYGIIFCKIDGWWNYERKDGLTCWEIDGGPFKTLKEAKTAALRSLTTHPMK